METVEEPNKEVAAYEHKSYEYLPENSITLKSGFSVGAASQGAFSISQYKYAGGNAEQYELSDHTGNVRSIIQRDKADGQAVRLPVHVLLPL